MLKTIEDISSKIVSSYDPERIILYGSHARGEAGPESDLDLLILKKTDDRPLERRIQVEKILAERTMALDLLVYTPEEMRYLYSIGSPFIEEVIETGRVLYMRKETESWIKDSEEELSSALILLKHDKFKGCCYHSQQSVEKGLKALILEKGERPPKIHDLLELLNHARDRGWEVALSLDDAIFLNSIYKGRYPTEEGLLPHGEPTRAEAEKAAGTAKLFVEQAKDCLMK